MLTDEIAAFRAPDRDCYICLSSDCQHKDIIYKHQTFRQLHKRLPDADARVTWRQFAAQLGAVARRQ